jgi:hypothetical protein
MLLTNLVKKRNISNSKKTKLKSKIRRTFETAFLDTVLHINLLYKVDTNLAQQQLAQKVNICYFQKIKETLLFEWYSSGQELGKSLYLSAL